MADSEIIELIIKNNGLGTVENYQKINIGFNNKVFVVNDKYIVKVCPSSERENSLLNEISFYLNNCYPFLPIMLGYDISKKVVPFCYVIQEKIYGCNLYMIWSSLSKSDQISILNKLLCYLKEIHSNKGTIEDPKSDIINEYDKYLCSIVEKGVLETSRIEWLKELKTIISSTYEPIDLSLIHGDLQFNNIMYMPNGEIKLIDFEQNEMAPTEKEFSPLFRMADYPKAFMQTGNSCKIDENSFQLIKTFFVENYFEICGNENFDFNLLIYDIINSLRWIIDFPNFPRYNQILFEESKKLIR